MVEAHSFEISRLMSFVVLVKLLETGMATRAPRVKHVCQARVGEVAGVHDVADVTAKVKFIFVLLD